MSVTGAAGNTIRFQLDEELHGETRGHLGERRETIIVRVDNADEPEFLTMDSDEVFEFLGEFQDMAAVVYSIDVTIEGHFNVDWASFSFGKNPGSTIGASNIPDATGIDHEDEDMFGWQWYGGGDLFETTGSADSTGTATGYTLAPWRDAEPPRFLFYVDEQDQIGGTFAFDNPGGGRWAWRFEMAYYPVQLQA